ncbi:SbtR family transcriptional regulator [Nocardia coffeae]|uniref:SbtR family transcriptional regulator n=1 Tax=Nocardia coffeae TaxID=2873381 RepID=UPI0035589BE5
MLWPSGCARWSGTLPRTGARPRCWCTAWTTTAASCTHPAWNDIGEELLDRAGHAAALGPDATAADLFTLINAAAWAREHVGPGQADRLITLALNGLRVPTDWT